MLAALWTVVTVLCVVVVVLTITVVGLMRRVLPALQRAEAILASGGPSVLEGLPVGSVVPPFVVNDLDGRPVPASVVLDKPLTLVLFLSTYCDPCQGLSRDLTGQLWGTSGARLTVIQTIDPGASPLSVSSDVDVYVQGADLAASQAFGSNVSPHAFLLDRRATILQRIVPSSVADLRALAAWQQGDTVGAERSTAGEPAGASTHDLQTNPTRRPAAEPVGSPRRVR